MTRAVIYCRVSTEEECQINALADQIQSLQAFISAQGWVLVDQYIDEGISGTTTKRRNEYKRLFQDIAADHFDIIVIKSQDRLMRSTKDWYIFVDRLVKNRKRLFFYLDNKFYTPEDALIMGIKAILAEEYSRDLSGKINNAHRYRQSSKDSVILTSNTWGYDKIGKAVVINEQEAEIVRMMYRMCAEGDGTTMISKALLGLGIYARSGKPFYPSTIRRIIRNPLFKGTAVMNKRHFDFNTKKNIRNDEKDWIYKENIVPAIVSKDLWERANREMDKHTKINRSGETMAQKRGVKIGASGLSGRLICGECGAVFWRTRYKRANGEYIVNWCCREYVQNGRKTQDPYHPKKQPKRKINGRGCDNIHIKDADLEKALSEIANRIYTNKEAVLSQAISILREVLRENDTSDSERLENQMETLRKRRAKLLDKYLDDIIEEAAYLAKDAELQQQLAQLNADLALKKREDAERQSENNRMEILEREIMKILDERVAPEFLYRHLKSITVYPERLAVCFDIFPPTEIKVQQINYHKKILSV